MKKPSRSAHEASIFPRLVFSYSSIMRALSLAVSLLASQMAWADEPPSYMPFSVQSANAKFIAKVDVADKGSKPHPWQWRYRITVFDATAMSKPLWATAYAFDGYAAGVLSNDGSCFAYVNFWFFGTGPLASIYCKGNAKNYSAADLRIDSKGLEKTASHQRWLKGSARFWHETGSPANLIIETVQGDRKIDLQ